MSAGAGVRPGRFALWGLVGLLVCRPGRSLPAQEPTAPEFQVKAVFLYNFAQFVDWPPEVFADSTAPVVIGVLGEDPFGAVLDNTLRGERIAGHPLEVRRFRSVADLTPCQILFIGTVHGEGMEQVLAALAGRPILTVSDERRFAPRGGMIGFVVDRSRIRFQVNLEAAQAARLTISSKLLRVADVVRPGRS